MTKFSFSNLLGLARHADEHHALDVAIAKATRAKEPVPKDKHVRALVAACRSSTSNEQAAYIVHGLLSRIKNAPAQCLPTLKALIVLHQLVLDAGEPFLDQLLLFQQRTAPWSALLLDSFQDSGSSLTAQVSAWVRAYAAYLCERMCVWQALGFNPQPDSGVSAAPSGLELAGLASAINGALGGLGQVVPAPDTAGLPLAPAGGNRLKNCEPQELLAGLPLVQRLMARLVACVPEGGAVNEAAVAVACVMVLHEVRPVYEAMSEGICNLGGAMFELQEEDTNKARSLLQEDISLGQRLQQMAAAIGKIQQLRDVIQFPDPEGLSTGFLQALEASLNPEPRRNPGLRRPNSSQSSLCSSHPSRSMLLAQGPASLRTAATGLPASRSGSAGSTSPSGGKPPSANSACGSGDGSGQHSPSAAPAAPATASHPPAPAPAPAVPGPQDAAPVSADACTPKQPHNYPALAAPEILLPGSPDPAAEPGPRQAGSAGTSPKSPAPPVVGSCSPNGSLHGSAFASCEGSASPESPAAASRAERTSSPVASPAERTPSPVASPAERTPSPAACPAERTPSPAASPGGLQSHPLWDATHHAPATPTGQSTLTSEGSGAAAEGPQTPLNTVARPLGESASIVNADGDARSLGNLLTRAGFRSHNAELPPAQFGQPLPPRGLEPLAHPALPSGRSSSNQLAAAPSRRSAPGMAAAASGGGSATASGCPTASSSSQSLLRVPSRTSPRTSIFGTASGSVSPAGSGGSSGRSPCAAGAAPPPPPAALNSGSSGGFGWVRLAMQGQGSSAHAGQQRPGASVSGGGGGLSLGMNLGASLFGRWQHSGPQQQPQRL